VSLDGRRLAVSIANDAGLYEVWISDLDRPRLSRFVHEAGRDCRPALWTRDGEALISSCGTTDEAAIYLHRVDAAEEPRTLLTFRTPDLYEAAELLPDGSAVVLQHGAQGKTHLVLLPLEQETGAPAAVRSWLEDASGARISADGRWLAYASDVSGRREVYFRPLGEGWKLGREIPVSKNGGGPAFWEDEASPPRFTFHSGGEVWSVVIDSSDKVSAPELVGDVADINRKTIMHAHLRDGRWIVALQGEGEELPDRVNVVLNWTEELKQRVAAQ
jgi:serine/threonine-protein kinase